MKPLIDSHTHTIHSGHAANTVFENARAAKAIGLEAIVTSDHGPAFIGYTRTQNLIEEMAALPEYVEGIRVYKGAEANIIDFYGDIDIPATWLGMTEFMVASFHPGTIKPGGFVQYTSAVLGTLENPYVDAIAHPGNPDFPVDIEAVVKLTAKLEKFVEINNHSPIARKGSEVNCMEFLRLCKKYGVKVLTASDAHAIENMGEFNIVLKMLKRSHFPDELVITADPAAFREYLEKRRHRLKKTDRS